MPEEVGNIKSKISDWEGLERSQTLGLFGALYTDWYITTLSA